MAANRRFSRASKSRRTPAGFPISHETQNRALRCRYITRLSIGLPDKTYTTRNPYRRRGTITVRLYNLERVSQVEATEEFGAWLEKREATAAGRAAGVAKRKAIYEAKIEEEYGSVLKLDRDADLLITADVIRRFYTEKEKADFIGRRNDPRRHRTVYGVKRLIIADLIEKAKAQGW